ncbi:hypothetical protein KRX54_03000 [Actinomycetaceae bacterium TAE3-ERU4]|nr:hypothetical protein [Actinomycetaceae bacterium TAE3-ERU4]
MSPAPFRREAILDAALAAALEPAFEGATFRMHEDGTAFEHRAKDTYVVATDWVAGQELPDALTGGHLLFFPSDVLADEVEALAVSLWEEAGWLSPGILGLCEDSTLTGPWLLTRQMKQKLGIPASAHTAYSVQLRREREVPPPDCPPDRLDPLFEHVMPVGEEYQTLFSLLEIVRRLGGGIRSDMGLTFEPDPDSNVNLTVYAPAWIPAPELIRELSESVPGLTLHASRPAGREYAPTSGDANLLVELGSALNSRMALRHLEAAGLTPEEVENISREAAKYDRLALEGRLPVVTSEEAQDLGPVPLALGVKPGAPREDYALCAPVGRDSNVYVEAFGPVPVPSALRWEEWAQGPIAAYEIRWEPADLQRAFNNSVPRSVRIERMNATTVIETIAAQISERVGGAVLDESGFLVAF